MTTESQSPHEHVFRCQDCDAIQSDSDRPSLGMYLELIERRDALKDAYLKASRERREFADRSTELEEALIKVRYMVPNGDPTRNELHIYAVADKALDRNNWSPPGEVPDEGEDRLFLCPEWVVLDNGEWLQERGK